MAPERSTSLSKCHASHHKCLRLVRSVSFVSIFYIWGLKSDMRLKSCGQYIRYSSHPKTIIVRMLSCLENNKRPLLPLCYHICPIQHSLKCAKESLCVFAVVSTNVFADVSVCPQPALRLSRSVIVRMKSILEARWCELGDYLLCYRYRAGKGRETWHCHRSELWNDRWSDFVRESRTFLAPGHC